MCAMRALFHSGRFFILFLAFTCFPVDSFASKKAVSVITLDPQTYTSASGEVHKFAEKRIVLYGPRWVTYSFEVDRNAEYLVQLSTAQVTSKPHPSADYRFLLDISIDEQKVISGAPLAADKSYVLSELIPVGKLSPGVHTITLKWTNDAVGENYDANLGIGSIEIFRA